MRFIALWMLALLSNSSHADTKQTSIDHGLLTADMTVTNPGTTTKHLVKIGVTSQVNGRFGCMPNSYTLIPLADYPVSFYLLDRETSIPADPPIALEPNASARFTISVHPYAGHWSVVKECGHWNVDVVIFALFDDGTRISTQTEKITDTEFYSFAAKGMSKSQVKAALSHRLSTLRAQALNFLDDAGFSASEERDFLKVALNDSADTVVSSAVGHVAKHVYTQLGPNLVALLKRYRHADSFDLYRALGTLKEQSALDPLMARLESSKGSAATDDWALTVAIADIDVKRILRARVLALIRAANRSLGSSPTDDAKSRYVDLMRMFMMYQDVDNFDIVEKALSDQVIRNDVLSRSRDILERPDTAFLNKIIPVWQRMLDDGDSTIRWGAFATMARLPPAMKDKLPLGRIKKAFGDISFAVDAATAACRFGYTQFNDRICDAWKHWGTSGGGQDLSTCVSERKLCGQ